MKKLDGVYVLDRLEAVEAYAGLGPGFAAAAAFLKRGGLGELPLGRLELDGERVFANVQDSDLVAPSDRRAELHHRYCDIQVPLAEETFGLARFDPASEGSFDEAKDVGFYRQEVEWFTLQPGEFGIFWPKTCLHAPSCTLAAPHAIRKIVMKILIP